MNYKLLNSGDHILNITANFIAIERHNKTIEIIPILYKNSELTLKIDSSLKITYFDDMEGINISDQNNTNSIVQVVHF